MKLFAADDVNWGLSMPTLYQTEQGTYFTRTIITNARQTFSEEKYITYQIHPKGALWLRQRGIGLDQSFRRGLLEELKDLGYAQITGERLKAAPAQSPRSVKIGPGLPVPASSHKPPTATIGLTPSVRSTLPRLYLSIPKNFGWSLHLDIPQFMLAHAQRAIMLKQPVIHADGHSGSVPLTQALHGEPRLDVLPTHKDYQLVLVTTIHKTGVPIVGQCVRGLRPIGTAFDLKTRRRIEDRRPFLWGERYLLLRRDDVASRPLPTSLTKCSLGSRHGWTLYLLSLPLQFDHAVAEWLKALSYGTG